jgi:small subunit ribosomal protein S17
MSDDRGQRKILKGVVVSNKMDKTIVVKVTRRVKHAMYKKYMSRSERYKAHDEQNDCGIGDTVEIRECRPLSKDKRWRLAGIIVRSRQ